MRQRLIAFATMGCVCLFALACRAEQAEFSGLSRPKHDVRLAFTVEGRLTQVLVKHGDTVAKGALLAKLDDSVEQARLKQIAAEADNVAKVLAAEAEYRQKEADAGKFAWAREKGAVPEWELERARLDALVSKYKWEVAEHERRQAGRQQEEMQAEIEKRKLTSPIDGTVEDVSFQEGESPRPLDMVVRVVNVDPLVVVVPVPLPDQGLFPPGKEVSVLAGDGARLKGTVAFVGMVADSASNTVTVRVEVPNPERRRAGERVRVVVEGGCAQPAPEADSIFGPGQEHHAAGN